MNYKNEIEFSSFRDPSGFLFRHDGKLYRQINTNYKENYDAILSSGLYTTLVKQGLMVPHEEVEGIQSIKTDLMYKIIRPEEIKFISYPYEWSFHQLRASALTTLKIARIALDYGMSLKDASAYNIQFHKGNWCLIDSLSFEKYQEGEPWVAYRQFCQHFLAPLALMAYLNPRLGLMNRLFIDGIPLDLASQLLPINSKLNFGLLVHIHLHALSQNRYADQSSTGKEIKKNFSKNAFVGILESLRKTIKKLKIKMDNTEWASYYSDTNYSNTAFYSKKEIIKDFIEQITPTSVWDIGANTGNFSRITSDKEIFTVAFDIDPGAVAKNYLNVRKDHERNLLPLVMDLTNPSPGIGWAHKEREALMERGPVDLIMALALVHHLTITNNVPFTKQAEFLKELCTYLIIEFVPKSDSQVKRLLSSRRDIFDDYTTEGFEETFEEYFTILAKESINDSLRVVYFMKAK